jgi:hypothetical protein
MSGRIVVVDSQRVSPVQFEIVDHHRHQESRFKNQLKTNSRQTDICDKTCRCRDMCLHGPRHMLRPQLQFPRSSRPRYPSTRYPVLRSPDPVGSKTTQRNTCSATSMGRSSNNLLHHRIPRLCRKSLRPRHNNTSTVISPSINHLIQIHPEMLQPSNPIQSNPQRRRSPRTIRRPRDIPKRVSCSIYIRHISFKSWCPCNRGTRCKSSCHTTPLRSLHRSSQRTTYRRNSRGIVPICHIDEKFITFMDALKLGYKSKDQLHPHLSDLMTSLNTSMPREFEGRAKIVQWLITLNQMRAVDELTDDQGREVYP